VHEIEKREYWEIDNELFKPQRGPIEHSHNFLIFLAGPKAVSFTFEEYWGISPNLLPLLEPF
jgi:hypothetical protein